jgi:dihydrofolate reductase
MRKITAGLFFSLDGVVEAPGRWGFQYMDDEMNKGISAGISQADAILLGRCTYLEFAEMWPGQGNQVPMADFLNHTPKYVVSATLDKLTWQPATFIKGDWIEELTRMKQSPGKNIQVPGSPMLVRSLLRAGLLDELNLNICPVVVGSGMHLFDETTNMVSLKLVHSTILHTGVIGATYQPIPAGTKITEPLVSFPEAASRK